MFEILIVVLMVFASTFLGYSEVLRYFVEPNAKTESERKKINRNWHIFRDLALFIYLVIAWLMPNNLIETLIWIPLLFGIHWTFSDGIQNLIKGKTWFYISPYSGNYVEKFGKWYIKLLIILIGILIKGLY